MSLKISDSTFTGNYAEFGGGAIYREWSYAQSTNYNSKFMSILELESCIINSSAVYSNSGGSIKTNIASDLHADGQFFKYTLTITDSIIGHSSTAEDSRSEQIEFLRRRTIE